MISEGFNRANRAEFQHFPPGARPSVGRTGAGMDLQPGDFVLTHGAEFFSQLIRFGQQIRFRGKDNIFTYWNHAALVVSAEGTIVEALGAGVERRSIDEYANTQFTVVRIEASSEDRAEAAAFAERCVGLEYGWTTVVSIALSLLTGGSFNFGFAGQMICSGLVARALERTTAIFAQDPSHVMPAELAKIYGVVPPPPGSPKGQAIKRVTRTGARTPAKDLPSEPEPVSLSHQPTPGYDKQAEAWGGAGKAEAESAVAGASSANSQAAEGTRRRPD